MRNLIFFIIYLVTMLVLGIWEDMLILLVIVTLHELSHVIVASLMGLKVRNVSFTLIGQVATIKGLELKKANQKILIYLAGPLMNIILLLLTMKFFPERFYTFKLYNIVIGLFNLLPAIPLDGGRIFQVIVGNKIGVLKANRILARLSKIVAAIIICVGFVQVILYPPNISLLCVGIYISKIMVDEKIKMVNDFYKMLFMKDKRAKSTTLRARHVVATKDTAIVRILKNLTYDDYFIINIINDDEIIYTITETEFVNYIVNYGVVGNLFEIMITYKNKIA